MFKKILIANRGEIACRIIRTVQRMGIRAVAVYSEADREALHVQMADEAICVGPPPSAESYLVVANILSAVKASGAEAVHPGYGFLSENRRFVRALSRAGVAFIGPKEKAVAVMGDKIESKKLAAKAGVAQVPGFADVIRDAAHAVRIARKVGYPVMIKASAGGGGKGMRQADDDQAVREGFRAARREAKSSFGDDRVFIEKFIENPRHIEIQVLADRHGNVIHLGERECSVQRRHQKVIEESPSTFLDTKTRAAMGAQAVALAKAVNYVSAGTVEFIVDAKKNFYFLEMNTRLQVEHPVTEFVTGLDLVEEMIRIAAGERLRLRQDEVSFSGWAIEARVYAEDPFRGFLPSTGRLVRYRPPAEDESVRVDTGVFEGGEISVFYDPMIAKLVAYGENRDEAITRMRGALDAFYIRGISHNISFLASVLAHPRFAKGNLSTNFIDEEYGDGFTGEALPHDDANVLIAVAATIHRLQGERDLQISGRLSGRPVTPDTDWVVKLGDDEHMVRIERRSEGFEVAIGKKSYQVETNWTPGVALFRGAVNGARVCVQIDRAGAGYRLTHAGAETRVLVLAPRVAEFAHRMPEKKRLDASRILLAPMPGFLLSVAVKPGQSVKAGEEIVVIEAMKMENVLRAERDGTVAKVLAKPGDSVDVDQPLLEFEKEGGAA
jgi:propionyl-CoA carboxylase alpha chain